MAIVSAAADSRRAWRVRVNYPLYLPAELTGAKSILIREGRGAFISDLSRLADSGVASAAAVLAVLGLYGDLSGSKDPARALARCERFADSGDEYVSFVMGWAYVASGDHVNGLRCMSIAAERLFPPAALGLASFAWKGIGLEGARSDAALRFLDGAKAVGHAFEPVMRSAFFLSGRLGKMRRLLGMAMYPVALSAFAVATQRDVFSSRVFHINLVAKKTMLRCG